MATFLRQSEGVIFLFQGTRRVPLSRHNKLISEVYHEKKCPKKFFLINQSLRCAMMTVFYEWRGKILVKQKKSDNAPIFPTSLCPSSEIETERSYRISSRNLKNHAYGSTLKCKRVIVQWPLDAGIFRRCMPTSIIAYGLLRRHQIRRGGAAVDLALVPAEPTRSLRLCLATIGSWILTAGLRLSCVHLQTVAL